MKAEIKDNIEFPIHIDLTIENEQDIKELWHRLNLSDAEIEQLIVDSDYDYIPITIKGITYDLFFLINNIAKKLNILMH